MAKAFIDDTNLKNIGNAIRKKGKTTELLLPSEMPKAIEDLPTGLGKPTLIYQLSTNDGSSLLGDTLTVNGQEYPLPDLSSTSINIETQPETTYTATLSAKAGYIASELQSYTTNPQTPIYIIEGGYTLNVAYIDVSVTSADGAIPTGITITVGSQSKAFEGTNPVRFTVEAKTRYDVDVSSWEGGTTPIRQTVTTGDINSVTEVKMEYTQMPVVGKVFNDYTPVELKQISDKEAWADYNFKAGDRHSVELKGTVNGVDLTGTWYAMIIGFNHNSEREGKGITLQFANNTLTGGNNLAFAEYRMNASETNAGGWEKSEMRTKTCAEFYNALPKEWQDIIKVATKYTDNIGGGNDNNPITATEDKIFIPAEFEVHGSRTYANSHEQNYQLQYEYYKSGNSKIRYKHTSTSTSFNCWERSSGVFNNRMGLFGLVNSSGKPAAASAKDKFYGFAPAFVI